MISMLIIGCSERGNLTSCLNRGDRQTCWLHESLEAQS